MARRTDAGLRVGTVRHGRGALLRGTALQAAGALVFAGQVSAQPAPNARPVGGQVVAGAASIGQSPAQTVINQSSQRAAIDWHGFDVGAQHAVRFNQPSKSAVTLNRVTGPDPSQIAGQIVANGNIIITNPSGVVFHRGAQVNAQSLIASAPGITNQNFMAGRMVFDQAPKPGAVVSNAGTITVKEAGLAALVAPRVVNSGVINARLGRVVLAGAEAHTIDLYGDGLVSIDVTKSVRQAGGTAALVTNSGTVLADGGSVLITARAADGIVQDLVQAGGRIQANSVGGRTGRIAVAGVGGSVRIEGRVLADGGRGQIGGSIAVTASDTVTVAQGARMSASGHISGGTVALGTTLGRAAAGRVAALGGAAATTPAVTARRVVIEQGAVVAADGRGSGRGGTVAVLSTHSSTVDGSLRARGGARGGDGGVVEASSDGVLALRQAPDLSARAGRGGTLYLDPYDLVVGTGAPTVPLNGATVAAGDPPATGISYIAPSVLEQASRNGAVSISLNASHDLTVQESVNLARGTISLGGAAGASLSLSAGHDLNILANITLGNFDPNGQAPTLSLDAGHNLSVGLPVGPVAGGTTALSAYGAVTLTTTGPFNGDPSGSSITIHDGSTITSRSSVGIRASNRVDIGSNVRMSAGSSVGGGGLDVQAGSDITVGSNSTLGLGAGVFATVQLAAGGSVSIGTGSRLDGGGLGSVSVLGGNGSSGIENAPLPSLAGSVALESGASIGNAGTISVRTDQAGSGAVRLAAGSTIQATPSGFVSLASGTGGLALGGTVDSGANGSLFLGSGRAVVQGASGALVTSNLLGRAESFDLRGAGNQISQIGADFGDSLSATTGDVAVSSRVPLTVGSAIDSTGGGISVSTGHTITLIADALTIGAGAQPSSFSERYVYQTLFAPGGTVALQPLSAGRPVELVSGAQSGAALSITRDGPNNVTADRLVVGSANAGAVTVGSPGARLDMSSIGGGGGFTQLDLISGGAIRQAAGSNLTVAAVTANGASVALLGSGNQIGTLGASSASAAAFALATASPVTVTGSVNGAGSVSITAPNLTVAGSITAPTVSLVAASSSVGDGTLTQTGGVIGASTQLSLSAAGGVQQTGGSIAAGRLTGSSGGSVELESAGNAIATLGSFASGRGFRLSDGQALQVAGPVTDQVSIRLAATGPLTLTGSVNAPAVDLTATGAIVQTGGSLTATLLTGSGASAALGSAGNTVATLGLFSTAGDFALADGQALIVGGAVSVGGGRSLSLASDSIGIGEGGSLSAVGGTVALAPLTPGHAFALSSAVPIAAISGGAITASTLRIGSATTGDISIAGAFGLSQVGTLDLRSAGAVLEGAGDSLVGNTLTGGANSASLLGTNNRIGTLGGFATNAGFTLVDAQGLAVTGPVSDAASVSITAPNLTVAGSITAPTVSLVAASLETAGSSVGGGALTQTGGVIGASTQLSLSAAGGIQQTGGSMAAGLLTGSSSGVVGLDSAGNAIATLGTFAAGRGFRLSDGQALTVAGR